ncbi:hypothetical protein FA048_10015 [Pedobacter polaris]|uniref:Uncharacterized protein n=1 Tax=Pedobacter polaris TaxID=2571273 RepID=A0A4U1CTS9_9SPHI|nr:hypothetical protein [Pedobacter polaris]TKC10510.1 hypothetical protein FA048_10015 [Pedobacter polaris]
MKMVLIFFLVGSSLHAGAEPEVAELRRLYYKAAEDSSASAELSRSLKSVNRSSSPILWCYKGASYMMEAKYAFNPITKLARFRKGKAAIEQAISKEPSNVEMRFIRFSLQNNLPGFLGYNGQIQADKQKLLLEVEQMEDRVLRENITSYLIASKKCTKEELKKLKL